MQQILLSDDPYTPDFALSIEASALLGSKLMMELSREPFLDFDAFLASSPTLEPTLPPHCNINMPSLLPSALPRPS